MAKIFKGFRIDNCHGLPIHVTQYLIEKARQVNPHLLVFAEFFSSSGILDSKYVSNIGIDYLIRESLVYKSTDSLISMLNQYSNRLYTNPKCPGIQWSFGICALQMLVGIGISRAFFARFCKIWMQK